MAETHRTDSSRNGKVPEFLREPLNAAQARLEHLETEAQRVFKDLMDRGRASRKDLEQMVHKLSQQDWSFPEMRQRIEKLREQGVERATEWRGRADTFRAEALDRMIDLQSRAVQFLGVATREQVAELSKELDRLSRRIDGKGDHKAKKPAAKKSKGEA
jgi:polyhydroxyalkanoate synthesis regulator phasin